MTLPLGRDGLEVVPAGEFVPGVLIYGLRAAGAEDAQAKVAPMLDTAGWHLARPLHSYRLFGSGWEVWLWTLTVSKWPPSDSWTSVVEHTLASINAQNCPVAWLSSEGNGFVDPPDLFHPDHMTGRDISAARTRSGDFWCPVQLDQPWAALTDDDLAVLRDSSQEILRRAK